jgi:hypothetical protein
MDAVIGGPGRCGEPPRHGWSGLARSVAAPAVPCGLSPDVLGQASASLPRPAVVWIEQGRSQAQPWRQPGAHLRPAHDRGRPGASRWVGEGDQSMGLVGDRWPPRPAGRPRAAPRPAQAGHFPGTPHVLSRDYLYGHPARAEGVAARTLRRTPGPCPGGRRFRHSAHHRSRDAGPFLRSSSLHGGFRWSRRQRRAPPAAVLSAFSVVVGESHPGHSSWPWKLSDD